MADIYRRFRGVYFLHNYSDVTHHPDDGGSTDAKPFKFYHTAKHPRRQPSSQSLPRELEFLQLRFTQTHRLIYQTCYILLSVALRKRVRIVADLPSVRGDVWNTLYTSDGERIRTLGYISRALCWPQHEERRKHTPDMLSGILGEVAHQ
jgi:hypothetical protein